MIQPLFKMFRAVALGVVALAVVSAGAQDKPVEPQKPATDPQSAAPQQQPSPQPAPIGETGSQETAPPKGTVLFQSHGEPPVATAPSTPGQEIPAVSLAEPKGPELTDNERSALTITGYDMDARLTPATSRMVMRAKLTVRNDHPEPLTRLALQISSTLRWESVALVTPDGSMNLDMGQHLLDTDADHTGQAREVIITLPSPLEQGKTAVLTTFYSGIVAVSGDRLESIGAAHEQAIAADWDGIAPGHTSLRGFGNVLWYPVASPQVFLGDGAEVFEAIGHTELREQEATVRLRVGVDYSSDPPAAVYFCGRRQPLVAVSDNPDAPISVGTGIATAEFPEQPLGFRLPSLFLVEHQESLIAPAPLSASPVPAPPSSSTSSSSSSSSDTGSAAETPEGSSGSSLLAVESDDDGSLRSVAIEAEHVSPLLQEWLGGPPLSALTVLDHSGQPFEDGPLLVAPVGSLAVSDGESALVHGLTHAWVQTGRPWMDEGLAQFFSLLWTERENGRDKAVAQLHSFLDPLALAEPAPEEGKPALEGQPLIAATSEMFFRRKAASVWWMLRGLAGDRPLQLALQGWRTRTPGNSTAEEDARAFEALLEKTSGKDLHWFFEDWILHDRGLPDLSITDVTPHQLPAATGRNSGWLVSVTVHNDGGATAEVPVVVRSGTFSTTSMLRVPALANATARVLVEAVPTEVSVNDGSTPEIGAAWKHTRTVVAQTETTSQ